MPTMAGEIACVAAVGFNHFVLSDDRDRYREAFQHFMDSERIDLMVEQRRLPCLTGERRDVSAVAVVLLDLAELTASRREDPEVLVEVLGLYRDRISSSLIDAGGCIGRHSGSSITSVFGAPLSDARHPFSAGLGAIAVARAVEQLHEELESKDLPALRVGIGLRSRTMLVANVGGERFTEYTAIGGEMDLTLELARANADRDSVVLVDAETADRLRVGFEIEERGIVSFGDIEEEVFEIVRSKPRSARSRRGFGLAWERARRPLRSILPSVSRSVVGVASPHDPPESKPAPREERHT
jgi:adenylate cyclase